MCVQRPAFSAPLIFIAIRWQEQTNARPKDAFDRLQLFQIGAAYLQKRMEPGPPRNAPSLNRITT